MAVTSTAQRPQQQQAATQSRLVRAIINPDELISELLPQPKQRDPNTKRLEDSKFARAIGGSGIINYGIGGEPDPPKELPPIDEPLADVIIDTEIASKLPRGHVIRSLQRADFDNGYLHLKNVGLVSREKWDARCEYLRSRSDTYVVLVVTNSENWVLCSGTLMIERKFTHDLCLVGHVQDLLVSEGQSGKNLGGRMMEALDQVARDRGCYKTMVCTNESNETFHQERDFKRAGMEMSHHHFVPRKTPRPRASSRDPSPEYAQHEREYEQPKAEEKAPDVAVKKGPDVSVTSASSEEDEVSLP